MEEGEEEGEEEEEKKGGVEVAEKEEEEEEVHLHPVRVLVGGGVGLAEGDGLDDVDHVLVHGGHVPELRGVQEQGGAGQGPVEPGGVEMKHQY